jgi:UDP-N-acetylglucosamine 2-epimerase
MSDVIVLAYGTRPQVIKASVLRPALQRLGPVVSVDSGQHYDHALNQLLYDQLGVPPADHYLDVGSGAHGEQTARVLERAEALFASLHPSAVVVIGDTNSTLGLALAAAKLRLPVVHVEAGLRAGDPLMAEELNRRLVDALSAVLCTPSARASDALAQEHQPGQVVQTGDVARDVLRQALARLPSREPSTPDIVATIHRAELTDRPERLRAVLAALASLDRPILLPLHPRTRAAMERAAIPVPAGGSLRIVEPLGYLDLVRLVRDARLVITDSGGVQREAYWLGTPCITLRHETEWAETVAAGANHLLAPEQAEQLLALARTVLDAPLAEWPRDAYGDGAAAERIAHACEHALTGRV